MLVADTELLFALSPRDPKHRHALRALEAAREVVIPDVALLEFQVVLRSRGAPPSRVRLALLALREILDEKGVRGVKTLSLELLALQCDLEERHGLSFFDSLIAAAALSLRAAVLSDDEDFDRVEGLERVPLTSFTG